MLTTVYTYPEDSDENKSWPNNSVLLDILVSFPFIRT